MEELMLKIENVSKKYRLGEIGGTTLREEFQRLFAKIRKKEDPTKKIGAKNYNKGETFMALKDISFDVKKGERVGIIGHNGAGKSTLLKLISRVTAPTEGNIKMNGRVASMLEVGTGFHPELTGRENVYMNGAILGMTKKEIDAKMEDIIEFSEVRQFIDTPVKRYSSGMYVKLAFSVAAHLDSEIMIMDEVLAVGDMAFQKKCIEKMNQVSRDSGRTILYVSHNMNTIRQLCNRVVVLDHGKVIFNGDVEEGINVYFGINNNSVSAIDLLNMHRESYFKDLPAKMKWIEFENKKAIYPFNGKMRARLTIDSTIDTDCANLFVYPYYQGFPITRIESEKDFCLKKGENVIDFEVDLQGIAPLKYTMKIVLNQSKGKANSLLDVVFDMYSFSIIQDGKETKNWDANIRGFFISKPLKIVNVDKAEK